MRTKRRFESMGTVTEILVLIMIVSVLSLVLNMLGASGYKTESGTFETTLITVNNIFSIEGIKHILNNIQMYTIQFPYLRINHIHFSRNL